jgi:hypothetical protein
VYKPLQTLCVCELLLFFLFLFLHTLCVFRDDYRYVLCVGLDRPSVCMSRYSLCVYRLHRLCVCVCKHLYTQTFCVYDQTFCVCIRTTHYGPCVYKDFLHIDTHILSVCKPPAHTHSLCVFRGDYRYVLSLCVLEPWTVCVDYILRVYVCVCRITHILCVWTMCCVCCPV